MSNVLVIGLGPHSELNHLPALLGEQRDGRVGRIVGFDVPAAAERIDRFTAGLGSSLPVYYADAVLEDSRDLPASVIAGLDDVVDTHRIQGVVVACEASFHTPYVLWALGRGLHVLLDKPVSMRTNSSTDSVQARRIGSDYDAMARKYREARTARPGLGVAVMCQRRFHPLYRRVHDLLAEVAAATTCPVTSMQSFHSDGQWRLPNELVDISYHSFDRGYGKIAHSGYHFIDFMTGAVRAGLDGAGLDEIEVFTSASRPADYLAQLRPEAYPGLFARLPFSRGEVEERIAPRIHRHGEVDAFISLAFRREGRVLGLGSINLVHSGLSLRDTAVPDLANLYRGNGRLRQESHIIEQGPFQAIHIHSLRSGESRGDHHATGGEGHLEVHVFRNNRLFPQWQPYERLTIADVTDDRHAWSDHQRGARNAAITEFVGLLGGTVDAAALTSDLLDHDVNSVVLSSAYLSLARRCEGGNPHITAALP